MNRVSFTETGLYLQHYGPEFSSADDRLDCRQHVRPSPFNHTHLIENDFRYMDTLRSRLSSDDNATIVPHLFSSDISQRNNFNFDEAIGFETELAQLVPGPLDTVLGSHLIDDAYTIPHEDFTNQTLWNDLVPEPEVDTCLWRTEGCLLPEHHTNTLEATMASATFNQLHRASDPDTPSSSTTEGVGSVSRTMYAGSTVVTPSLTPQTHLPDHFFVPVTTLDMERSINTQEPTRVTSHGSSGKTPAASLVSGTPPLVARVYIPIEAPTRSEGPSS